MTVTSEAGDRLLVPVPNARHLLGGIGLTKFYEVVNEGELEVVHIGRRVFVTADSLKAYVERLRAANRAPVEHAAADEPVGGGPLA